MAKKKKQQKPSGLSEMNKTIACALGFKATDNVVFRKNLQRRRSYLQNFIVRERIPTFYNAAASKSVEELLRKLIRNGGASVNEAMSIQNLLLEFWMEDKRSYTFSPEAISFIDNKFCAEEMGTSVEEVLKWACAYPLFLKFPEEALIEKAFCGCIELPSKFVQAEQCESNVFFYLDLFQSNGDTSCTSFILSDVTAKKLFESNFSQFPLLYKSLLYLGYLFHKADPKDYVLIPQELQNSKAYQVLPIPSPDWVPEFADSSAWMKMGLRSFFNFLDRDKMLSVFAAEQVAHAEYENLPYVMGCPENVSHEHLCYFQRQAVMDWEKCRLIYRFSPKTIKKVEARYRDIIDFDCTDLLQFMPAKAVVFVLSDPDDVVLISPCKTNNTTQTGVLFSSFVQHDGMMQIFNSDEIFKHNDNSLFIQACCALIHLLTIFKEKALSRLTPSSSLSFPYSNSWKENAPNPIPGVSPPLIGTPVTEMSTQLFDVSEKGVRRAKAEMERIYGRKSPHVRRQHIHHYWVGKGEDRHLEARLLEPIRVNCTGFGTTPTTLREVF